MYIKIGPTEPDDDFSYIIAKNPSSAPYERQVGGPSTGRRVVGRFAADGMYQVVVHNDLVLFFNEMRARNEAAYVRPEPWLICPANLKGMSMAFRSALAGNAGKELPAERFHAPKMLRAEVGPFPGNVWADFFEALGLQATQVAEGTTEASTLLLTTIAPMSVTVFLQKIYISMMTFTSSWAFYDRVETAQIDKFLDLTVGWLGSVPAKFHSVILNKLTGYRKSLQEKFEKSSTTEEKHAETEAAVLKDEKEAACERRMSLHEMRHALILANLPADVKKVVDLGSGEGKLLFNLLASLPEAQAVGIDAQRYRVNRMKRSLKGLNKRAQIYHDNLLYPRNWEELVGADVLIASEVIEHMTRGDRTHFIRLIAELLEPKVLFLTTPNIEANEPMFNMAPGELRHDDHKIEYTRARFEAEVVEPLSAFYDVTHLDVLPGEPIQPSFCIRAVRKEGAKSFNKGYIQHTIQRMSQASYFATTNVTVPPRDMREGMTSYPFLENSRHIFYLGPTMAPVDYISELDQYLAGSSEGGPYLEHPLACFRYYAERGVRTLVEEPKYMGSRAYALLFRDMEHAHRHGFKYPIVLNARSGGAFFKDPVEAMPIWQDVASKMKDDFMILDMEIMPWLVKAERMIARDFTLPGEAALLWRRRHEPEMVENAEEFLRMVRIYGANTPLEARVFHILAAGKCKEGKKNPNWLEFYDTRFGFYRTHIEQLAELDALQGDIVKPVAHHLVDLESEESKAASVRRWMEYCAGGGEGLVYKPPTFFTLGATGYPLQPALKVRGKDYLRIIYGMDYLRSEYLDRLKNRSTKMKRLMAVQEQEIAMQILRCFINGNELERLRAISAFMGLEFAQATTIDKTL